MAESLRSISSSSELSALSSGVVLLSFWTRWSQPSLHTLDVVSALQKLHNGALVVAKVLRYYCNN